MNTIKKLTEPLVVTSKDSVFKQTTLFRHIFLFEFSKILSNPPRTVAGVHVA
jgi:hypothetical protein